MRKTHLYKVALDRLKILVSDTNILFLVGMLSFSPLLAAEAEQKPEFQAGFGDVPQFGGPDGVSGQLRESDRAKSGRTAFSRTLF